MEVIPVEPLSREDILYADAYERARNDFRRRVLVLKDRRRVLVGDFCSVLFENRETMRYQIHEMLRAENGWDRPGAVDDELAAYNPLIPGKGELSATLMFEFDTPEVRAERLAALLGVDQHLWLQIGTEDPIPAQFDRMQISGGKISSVQFVKWRLNQPCLDLLREEGTVLRLIIDHPAYQAQAVVSELTRREIANDPN